MDQQDSGREVQRGYGVRPECEPDWSDGNFRIADGKDASKGMPWPAGGNREVKQRRQAVADHVAEKQRLGLAPFNMEVQAIPDDHPIPEGLINDEKQIALPFGKMARDRK